MVRCWNCIHCRAFVDSENQHPVYLCLFNDNSYLAYNDGYEVQCPHYKYRDSPLVREKASDTQLVIFGLSNHPPFVKSERVAW